MEKTKVSINHPLWEKPRRYSYRLKCLKNSWIKITKGIFPLWQPKVIVEYL